MSQIDDLANLMKVLRENGRRFVLMLGAGASMDSNVPDTRTMMKEVVDRFGSHIQGRDVEERFDVLMQGPVDNRRMYLESYLEKTPSEGYRLLAELIRDGYFEKVLTFNFDLLLENSLRELGVAFAPVIRGEFETSRIPEAMKAQGVQVLKLHGSLNSVGDFVFVREDLVDYPPPIKQALEELTAGHILVCGYAYNDQCVISSFSKNGPGNVVVVDPKPSRMLCDVAKNRGSQLLFSDKDGYFDTFFRKLSAALSADQMRDAAAAKQHKEKRKNPFKFLEAYREEDSASFVGRAPTIEEVMNGLREPGRPLFILGPAKDGKTSLVRAGVLPRLEPSAGLRPQTFLYLRCQPDLKTWLLGALERERRKRKGPAASDLGAALAGLAADGRRFYLVLDQFERVVRPYEKSAKGEAEFNALLAWLMDLTPPAVTVVYVIRSEGKRIYTALRKLGLLDRFVTLDYDGAFVEQAIKSIACREGIEFENSVVERLRNLYENSPEDERFTLAHVNAACHLLCDSGGRTLADLDAILSEHGEALNRLINRHDVMGFVEDVPDESGARSLLPRMMKLVFVEGRRDVAECLSRHFEELFPPAANEEEAHAPSAR